ncbi:MAG: tRNA (adenosine(37)-N6)-threonylcarbamoyltransferase complex ATPase subunit type 1 TsaE [Actinobacteria bacterium]|nr:tRNA (adenosine(37)-N6)-threonylcarbamoyltransferase complex ATPase subunit type 1 TsaE [Actinomycetota bacterium]
MRFKCDSVERTLDLGRVIGSILEPGDVVCLDGELGTGKTVLVRGIAEGLGYTGPVTSPTFMIIHPYPEIKLCHVDSFRLESGDHLVGAGIDDYLDGGWICAVEWAQKVRNALPEQVISLNLSFGPGGDERLVELFVSDKDREKLRYLEKGLGDHEI